MLCLSGFELYSRWVPLETEHLRIVDVNYPLQGSWSALVSLCMLRCTCHMTKMSLISASNK